MFLMDGLGYPLIRTARMAVRLPAPTRRSVPP